MGEQNEIYIAGLNDPLLELPEKATDAKIDEGSIEQLLAVWRKLLGPEGSEDEKEGIGVLREGVCFGPVTGRGVPILARVEEGVWGGGFATGGASPKTKKKGEGGRGGVLVAAGHGPWGISLSLGTGKVMQEMIEGVPAKGLSAEVRGLGMQWAAGVGWAAPGFLWATKYTHAAAGRKTPGQGYAKGRGPKVIDGRKIGGACEAGLETNITCRIRLVSAACCSIISISVTTLLWGNSC
jgi:hypothetical protein